MQSMVERLPGVAPPIWRSNPDSYADTPFVEEITSVEMPRKFSFPSIKMYDGTGDPDCNTRVSTPTITSRSTSKGCWRLHSLRIPAKPRCAKGLSDKFVEQFASSRSLEKTSDGLYEILQHRVEHL
ncbi:hypothetical protein F2Q70_00043610 [Brassica cretica]|uniref:Uncharacterized protein n=1 Tax=Brassica cretica TaxID=69181 RepID=A0A8S9KIA9_BRACR|nr:hypothetical protein F2Q70_00043610 [Brassica cretica]KAF2607237.1 hypothetical protein F2Q68_00044621 [Brassica cretica]